MTQTRGKHFRRGRVVGTLTCFLGATGAFWIAGCVPKDPGFADGGACSAPSIPAICPTPAPSFQMESGGQPSINDTIQAYCAVSACHAPGGQEASVPFQTYAQIFSATQNPMTSFIGQLSNCIMPPKGNPQPPIADLAALMAWVVCGAPDN
jgi:hypothetical protein